MKHILSNKTPKTDLHLDPSLISYQDQREERLNVNNTFRTLNQKHLSPYKTIETFISIKNSGKLNVLSEHVSTTYIIDINLNQRPRKFVPNTNKAVGREGATSKISLGKELNQICLVLNF